ncbi:MAG: CRISPR-associated helicase Cas3' [Nitrospiraceae bacterium]|nr:CRISPR-associated helicase Cas3' [Nitrospiraceae bacterium]
MHYARRDDAGNWQQLENHLEGVSRRAARFAHRYGAEEWARLAGLWHDIGKYQAAFQARLRGEAVRVEHSGAGAALAFQKGGDGTGAPLAFAVAGHHTGIANYTASGDGCPTPLRDRLRANESILTDVRGLLPAEALASPLPPLPAFLQVRPGMTPTELEDLKSSAELWTRFLFSALVDADWLDTEAFMEPDRAQRRGGFSTIEDLCQSIDESIDIRVRELEPERRAMPVNRLRAHVLAACRKAATEEPGFFALTVPTGGGKTLSAMSFALNHAKTHQLERVIVVIPYTSIIEQNAQVYRDALGAANVVEHHSNLTPLSEEKEQGHPTEEIETTQKLPAFLAMQNWDAPVIITTTVQFFESLFSNRPSRCRKLHNIAGSVIVLDEVQALPPAFLLSILDALKQLVAHYGCSVVLSTATPPALAARERFDAGIEGIHDIVPNRHADESPRLQRVQYSWPDLEAPSVTWPALAEELIQHPRVLAIVHKRADARELTQLVHEQEPDTPLYHLSALMCPAHRAQTLDHIKKALATDAPCRVISTQLVEAGVDLDFPIVFRALAGLDSIVQAAGRCNREGRSERGEVLVFRAPTLPPPGVLRSGLEVTESLLREGCGSLAPEDPALFEEYFRALYFTQQLDAHGIQAERRGFNFATVARRFKLIEDGFSHPIVVPFGNASQLLEKLRQQGPSRHTSRVLQLCTVSIYDRALQDLDAAGALERIQDSVLALTVPYGHLYHKTYGLLDAANPVADQGALIVSPK